MDINLISDLFHCIQGKIMPTLYYMFQRLIEFHLLVMNIFRNLLDNL